MRRLLLAVLGLALVGFAAFLLLTQPRGRDMAVFAGLTGDAVAGEQVFWAAGCASCHMAEGASGEAELVLSGGQKFASDFGTFLAPNISTDPEHGIGGWTLEQFACAIQDGISPEGQHYFPVLPFAAYSKMVPQDVANLKAFMDTLPASSEPSKPHEVGFPFNIRRTLGMWKLLLMKDDYVLTGTLTPEVERGRYITEALAHCGECHTPRNLLGGLQTGKWLAGAPIAGTTSRTPNITPAKLTWSAGQIVEYLTSGFTPEFDSVGGHMAHVVENMARLPESDRAAVAAYLLAVAPVE